eukprot:c11139_g1_i2.p1 GENE.c11139_g1_i2~~c11139_g1_i2.p1  ORF type:complete len:689 (-),score=162.55 c11139_g1_i2:202-2010(-)
MYAMLTSGMSESLSQSVLLQDVSADVFELVLDYMYNSDVLLTSDNVLGVLEFGVMYDIRGLSEQCVEALVERMDASNAWQVLHVADKLELTSLRQKAMAVVIRNFHLLTTPQRPLRHDDDTHQDFRNGFLHSKLGTICEVISSQKLCVNENVVFEAVEAWLHHKFPSQQSPTNESQQQPNDYQTFHHVAEAIADLTLAPSTSDESRAESSTALFVTPTSSDTQQCVDEKERQETALLLFSHVRFCLMSEGCLSHTVAQSDFMSGAASQRLIREAIAFQKLPASVRHQQMLLDLKLRPRKRSFPCEFELFATLTQHKGSVLSLAVSDTLLFSGSKDRTIRVWDMHGGYTCRHLLRGHAGSVYALLVLDVRPKDHTQRSEKFLVSGSDDKTIAVWNLEAWQCERVLVGHEGPVLALASTGQYLLSGSLDTTIRVWDCEGGWVCVRSLSSVHRDAVWSMAVSVECERLVSSSVDGSVVVWDTKTWLCEKLLTARTLDLISLAMLESPTLMKMVSGSADGTIKVWDMASWECDRTIVGQMDAVRGLMAVGDKLISGLWDGSFKVWDTDTWSCERTIKAHTQIVNSIVAVDGVLFTASDDGKIKVWK